MAIVNTHQAEAWNGYEGAHWAGHHDRYDAMNGVYNEHLLRFVRDGDRVLDVGCGAGQLTRLAARRGREATGLDLSAPMLAKARELAAAEGVGNVTFTQGDAQVHDFGEGAYDLAVSRFGIMFFADPVAAFRNIGSALVPGGRVAFLSLRDIPELVTVLGAMAAHLPPPPESPDGTSPASLADPARVQEVFTAAGFTDVEVTPVEADQVWGRDTEDAAAFLAGWGPIRYRLSLADPASAERATAALAPALRPYERAGAVRLRGYANLISGVRT
ncbi:methyltransferase domain-containing protein [Nonomuraea sp. NPDC049486]|uniref:class I SAM-dependent methyltransferase n=1 Tax=Nonomuraea sp. NPDC049486 TaxID=3155773 RepID=UPI00341F30D3